MVSYSLTQVLGVVAVVMAPMAIVNAQLTYTVHGAVVLSRTGERTPFLARDARLELTSTGAHQLYSAGKFYRKHFIAADDPVVTPSPIWG